MVGIECEGMKLTFGMLKCFGKVANEHGSVGRIGEDSPAVVAAYDDVIGCLG